MQDNARLFLWTDAGTRYYYTILFNKCAQEKCWKEDTPCIGFFFFSITPMSCDLVTTNQCCIVLLLWTSETHLFVCVHILLCQGLSTAHIFIQCPYIWIKMVERDLAYLTNWVLWLPFDLRCGSTCISILQYSTRSVFCIILERLVLLQVARCRFALDESDDG